MSNTDDYFSSVLFKDDEGINSSELIHRNDINSCNIRYNHHIDARQPGSGKTTNMVNSINANPEGKHLVIASTHEFLDEIKQKIYTKFVILKGFPRACRKYDDKTTEGDIIRKMHKNEIPKKLICKYLKCKGACPYRNQFKQALKKDVSVGMPVQFLPLFEFNIFDSVHIEERVQGDYELPWDEKEFLRELIKLNGFINPDKYKQIWKYIQDKNLESLQKEAGFLTDVIITSNINKIHKHKKAYKKLTMPDSWFLNSICKLDVNKLLFYLELKSRDKANKITNNNSISLSYQQFLFYKQLNYNIDLRYNCATFPKNEFLHDLKIFEELFPEYAGVLQIKRTHHTNEDVKLIKMGDSGFYKSCVDSQFEAYKSKIKKLIRNEKYNKGKKVCILTYKYLVKNNKFLGIDAFWFGASHGVNKYRKYDVLIVLGTYLPNLDAYKEYYLEHHPDEDIPDFNDFTKSDGKMIPKDERLHSFYKEKFEDDVYDSVHRLRPLWRKDGKEVTIYWIGHNVPEKLKDEFDYQERDF